MINIYIISATIVRMSYQIDQSGKIEQTSLDTIIALSNDHKYSLFLPKKTKRALQEIFRNEGRPRMFIYDTFSALLAFLFSKIKPKDRIIIDKEYKNEALIKARVLAFLKILQVNFIPDIEFGLVGKSSPAHILAAKVGNKKIKSNLILTLEEISEVLWPSKKTGYSSISGTEGNLTQDWIPGGQKPSRSLIPKRYHKNVRKSRA